MAEEQGLDPEITEEFRKESMGLLEELKKFVVQIEGSEGLLTSTLMSNFAQRIDRIMGAAKTLGMMAPDHVGLQTIGKLAELCKSIGYKAAEKNHARISACVGVFWEDVIEIIEKLLTNLENKQVSEQIVSDFSAVLTKRLEWIAGKLA